MAITKQKHVATLLQFSNDLNKNTDYVFDATYCKVNLITNRNLDWRKHGIENNMKKKKLSSENINRQSTGANMCRHTNECKQKG